MPKKIIRTTVKKEQTGINAPVVGVDGKRKGSTQLPKALFGAKINTKLLAQAVRVYLSNQRAGGASTKTRGQVEGSTRKIYRQKGTGRARHGAIRAPIFVGGGIVFGPHARDFRLELPKKAKRAALAAALTSQLSSGNVIVVDGMGDLPPKTKEMVKTFDAVGATGKILLVTGGQEVSRAARNIRYVDVMPANMLHAYAVLSHQKLVVMKDAVKKL